MPDMKNLTPSETEVLKMFDEQFNRKNYPEITHTSVIRDFLLTQIRLARADERKQAYEEGYNERRDMSQDMLSKYVETFLIMAESTGKSEVPISLIRELLTDMNTLAGSAGTVGQSKPLYSNEASIARKA